MHSFVLKSAEFPTDWRTKVRSRTKKDVLSNRVKSRGQAEDFLKANMVSSRTHPSFRHDWMHESSQKGQIIYEIAFLTTFEFQYNT